MAHHSATKKSIRQTKIRTERNKVYKTRFRTSVKKVELAIAEKDTAGAQSALKNAQVDIMKAAKKGIVKLTTASRKLSRLNAQVKTAAGK